jgi:hypothetical protein
MSEEEGTVQKVVKVELGFDEASMAFIEQLKSDSRTETTPELVVKALQVYGWYLENRKHGFYTKRDETWVKIDLQL